MGEHKKERYNRKSQKAITLIVNGRNCMQILMKEENGNCYTPIQTGSRSVILPFLGSDISFMLSSTYQEYKMVVKLIV